MPIMQDTTLRCITKERDELRHENAHLLQQLHLAQEELESYYLTNQKKPKPLPLEAESQSLQDEQKNKESSIKPKKSVLNNVSNTGDTYKGWFWLFKCLGIKARNHHNKPKNKNSYFDMNLVKNSGLFDSAQYLRSNPDVATAGIDPIEHYLSNGWQEGRYIGPLFDADYYLKMNPDVKASGMNPLLHFIKFGRAEGRLGAPFA